MEEQNDGSQVYNKEKKLEFAMCGNAKLETIGISPIFFHCLVLDDDSLPLRENQQIIGEIKTSPSDFRVVEIGMDGMPAVVDDASDSNVDDIKNSSKVDEGNQSRSTHINNSSKSSNAQVQYGYTESSLKSFLIKHCVSSSTHPVNDFQLIIDLQNCAISQIKNRTSQIDQSLEQMNPESMIFITLKSECASGQIYEPELKKIRGIFHRSLKAVFPLLKSFNVNQNDDQQQRNSNIICVVIDDRFYELIRFIEDPVQSLINLNRFYHMRNEMMQCTNDAGIRDLKDGVDLNLAQSITKDERRIIHKVILKACRDFETSTMKKNSDSEDKATTCIKVKLCKRLTRKRRREGSNIGSECTSFIQGVLEKNNVEHLASINCLCDALYCKPSDIGMAGIKDKTAITSQFVTFRGIGLDELQSSKKKLSTRGIKLGSFKTISSSNHLTKGSLNGNRFDIIVRRLGLMRTRSDAEDVQRCPSSWINGMVERIDKTGVVNFYGEQRLGIPGNDEDVGVRSFDVGRAMLLHDYDLAVDLILTGSNKYRGNFVETEDIRNFRTMWLQSERNIEATLKCLPKKAGLHREKQLLYGLKRYGLSDPYAALCSLPFSIRSFWINAYQSYIWNICTSQRLKRYGPHVVVGDLYEHHEGTIQHVTDSTINSVNFDQLVMPLPGYNVVYPRHSIKEVYDKILRKDGIIFTKPKTSRAFEAVKGAYRRIIVPVKDITFDMTNSNTVRFQFQLRKGSYATMVLRELFMTTIQ